MASDGNSETIDVGIDYLTVTGTTRQSKQRVYNFGMRLVDQERKRGNDRRLWNWKQYDGFKSGSVSTGTRDDSAIVRIAGSLAREHYREAFDAGTNCSRVDTQVTVRPGVDAQRWISSEFKRALAWSNTLRKKPAVQMLWSNNGTATIYLNKRVSDQFGRIYDKGRESLLPVLDGCVRYEVEYKGDQAMHRLKSLVSSSTPHSVICSDLHQFFKLRTCRPPWKPEGTQTLVLHRIPTDQSRQLQWMRECVSPTVRRLVECGLAQEVYDCLSLADVNSALQTGKQSTWSNRTRKRVA